MERGESGRMARAEIERNRWSTEREGESGEGKRGETKEGCWAQVLCLDTLSLLFLRPCASLSLSLSLARTPLWNGLRRYPALGGVTGVHRRAPTLLACFPYPARFSSLNGCSCSAAPPQWTALHIAAENARVDVLRYLIDQEVDINARDNDDETPMHCAAFWGHTEIVHAPPFHVARVARPRGA